MSCSTQGLNASQLLLMGDSCGHRTMDTGNYDQCLGGGFQHCIVNAAGTLVGLCVPQGCGPADVTNASAPIFAEWINWQMPLLQQFVASGYYVSATCGDNAMPWSPIATCVVVLLAGIAALIGIATAAAWWQPALRGHNKDRTVSQFFVETFALQASVPALLKVHGSDRSGRLAALNGTRVLSMGWVILGHTIIFGECVHKGAGHARHIALRSAPSHSSHHHSRLLHTAVAAPWMQPTTPLASPTGRR